MSDNSFILFDPQRTDDLLPLAYTRSVADFRVGIFTIREKWEHYLKNEVVILTRNHLQFKYSFKEKQGVTYINASVLPDKKLVQAILDLKNEQVLKSDNEVIAVKLTPFISNLEQLYTNTQDVKSIINYDLYFSLKRCWDIFQLNGAQIESDLKFIEGANNLSQLGNAVAIKNEAQIFIEEGAEIESCILNASNGPIFIGKNAKILDGAMIRGPVAVCDNAVIKMGAKIYGETTIGPFCKVGGEVSNVMFFGYSNKGHDGYLGNSVIGEWCNLGADTNTSNLKNNYSSIKCWNYAEGKISNTGLQFCGLVMGDHSKCGINTMFNTGTTVGVAANIYGGDFPPKFIPSFSWGSHEGFMDFKLEKVYEMTQNMMKRRNIELTPEDKNLLLHLFEQTKIYRQN